MRRLITASLPAAVAALLLLAGCSGSSTTARPAATSLAPTPVATTDPPSPSAGPTSTPSPTASPTRSPAPSPTPTRRRPAVEDDVDGDGKADVIRTSATVLTVTLSGSGRTVTAPIHADAPGPATLLGSADVDRDGYAELFVETAQGASTSFATPYRFDGTALRELQLDGGPARLGIGGSVTHGDGFRCTPAGLLEIRSAESPDGASYTVHTDSYRLDRQQLVLVRSATAKAREGDPAVEASYTADCGSVGDGQ
ncbi:MAG: FG-GAP-like repeat-containing protein [Mycobacteriales bacterium]